MNRREKWILALAGPLVLFLLTIQGIGLWILGPFHKILVDHATEAMLAETAVVLIWNFWWFSRVERPDLQIIGCAAGLTVFSWCHRILVPLAGTALYVGILLLTGRNIRKGIFGKASPLPTAERLGLDLILGCALWIVIVCLVSLTGRGGLWLWRILAALLGAACVLAELRARRGKLRAGERSGERERPRVRDILPTPPQFSPACGPVGGPSWAGLLPENRKQALLAAFALTMVMVQIGRLNISLDYDSLHYGLRSAYVLDNGKGIFEDLGMVNLVYTYPKGLEVLALPLSGTPTYGFVLALSLWATVGVMLLAGHIAGRRAGKTRRFWAMAMLGAVPGVMNMAATAKSDNVTLLFQLLFFDFVCCALGAAGERQEKGQPWFLMGLCAYLMTLVLKPTAIVFSTIMAAVCLFCLVWCRRLRVILKGRGKWNRLLFLPLLPAAAVAGLWYRTWKMTGVPVTSIFAGVFERLGFTVRLPYTFTGVIGNPASLSAGEKLTRLVRRIWGMAVLPLGEDMDHVIIAWGTGLITLLAFLWVCWLIGFVRTGGMKGRRGFAAGEHAASSASLQPFCEALLLPALGLACIYSVYTLSQVDGNYFILFYTLLITGVSGIRCRHGRKTDLERNLSGLLAPLAVAGLFITCCTSWAGARGFTPVSLNHPGWYDHRSEVRERQAEAGISEIVSALTPRSRVVAFGEHPQVLDLPCSVQSYYDITGSGGNVYLVKKLDYFKWYLDISGTEYIFVETGYGDRQSRAGEMIRYMIEDNSLTDLVYENGNLLGRVQLGGPDSDGNPYDRQRIGREFAENFYQYMGK